MADNTKIGTSKHGTVTKLGHLSMELFGIQVK